MKNEREISHVPMEEKWFEVKPLSIDQKLFKEQKKDKRQEEIRRLILKAFMELNRNPDKYGKNFKTMIPKRDKAWSYKTGIQYEYICKNLGDHMADWVEQSLEWAQRIANGESWETVCNNADAANWYRLVEWEDGLARIVGGSLDYQDGSPASYVYERDYYSGDRIIRTVPLVVSYEK